MNLVAAVAATAAIVLLLVPGRGRSLPARMGMYLAPEPYPPPSASERIPAIGLRRAGLDWSRGELVVRRLLAGWAGAFVGLLLAQGDLFLTGARSVPGLAAAGTAAGVLGLNAWISTRRERRSRLLHQELPIIADSLALGVLAGESVANAVTDFAHRAGGVGAEELRVVIDAYRRGEALTEALNAAAAVSAHPDAGRLYRLLADAHDTGGQLASSLTELAVDYRAELSRELTAEGGRRAVAVYGPILALMLPVTLLFLIYPTLTGLRSLTLSP